MDFTIVPSDLWSLLISVLCGSAIGFEREYKNKSTGLRTIVLICLGSTLFSIVSRHGAGADDRISANIITGIGFIGAGVIFKDKLSVLGLTTAAVIWTTAAIGMTAGIGYHGLALFFTVGTLLILVTVNKLENTIGRMQRHRVFSITFTKAELGWLEQLEERIRQHQLTSSRLQLSKFNHTLNVSLKISGDYQAMKRLTEQMANMDEISDFYSN